jgi:23S rRNA (uracil1939-C5)-methyltransferase
MEPGAQILAKQQVLLDNLRHIGKTEPGEVLPPLTGQAWGYRTKARLGAKNVIKKGRVLVGFREKRSPYVADISRCEVLHPSVGTRLHELTELIEQLDAKSRIPQIEVAVAESVTALVFRHLDPSLRQTLTSMCIYRQADLRVCCRSGQSSPSCLTTFPCRTLHRI